MESVNKAINIDDLREGDEVIVRGIDLNYMVIVRPPRSKKITNQDGNSYTTWSRAVCDRKNGTIFGNWKDDDRDKVSFDFQYKSIWLVKRVGINK